MRRNTFMTLCLAAALAGCNLPTPTPMVLPICDTASLQAVTLVDPPMWGSVASLTPSLYWTYPDPSCNPEGYAITLRTGPLFSDDRGGGTGNPSTSWSPGSPLEPGKEYAWGVEPINGTTLGPFEGSNYFFTGPTCATAALVAPTLLQPIDGGSFDENHDSLIWDYPEDCAPEGYRVDLSVDPAFADTSLSGGTGNPSTRWGPGHPLSDCQIYYWRVAPINGTTLGPFSPSRSFVRDATGACGGPGGSPPASASIAGTVWDDENGDGVDQPAESGIWGVTLELRDGVCPGTSTLATGTTAIDGRYIFDGLSFTPPVTYCIRVDAGSPPNNAILPPGAWTYALSSIDGNLAYAELTFSSVNPVDHVEFGWHFTGSTATPAAALGAPIFTLDTNAFCRQGPGLVYKDITAIPAGDTVDILGRSQDNLWYFVFWKKFGAKCWIGASTGHPNGDLTGVVILVAPPTPTWTPTPAPAKKPSSTPTGKP